jgi:hypothetical protein
MAEEPPYGLEYSPHGFVFALPGEQPTRLLARSPNLEMAVSELTAYLTQKTDIARGRSCLIAGARGSGKTTLIDRACEEVRQKNGSSRLIRVRLHGPSLLNPPKPIPTKDNPTPEAIPVQEHVLKTLVINLYQTAAEEVSNSFKDYVKDRSKPNERNELSEFAAQLRLTLDGAPSSATLRFFWNRVEALSKGVLFREPESGQGLREIVALASAADAYRSCTGQYTQQKMDEKTAGDKLEAKTQISAIGKEISKALAGVVSGIAAGATAVALNQTKVTATLVGAITLLLSMVTLSYSRTRSRQTVLKEEVTFLPDTTVSALVHRVLLLLRRLRQAGLVPIFIIDELDKVINAVEPLNKLTTSLKFLFADEGFFCFLTDRAYFSEIDSLNREQVNSQLRTVYTTQLLVRYDTMAVHEFLKNVIRPYNTGGLSGVVPADLEADAEALRYILICRSRMLLFELSRDLASFSGTGRRLSPAFQAPRSNLAHQLHLAVQLAIELVLTNEFVANRINRDANFAQTIYDALYYPVNLWYADEREVNVSRDLLIRGIGDMTGEPADLEESDQNFLQTQVKAQLELLANLPELERRLGVAFDTKRLLVGDKGRLLDAVPTGIRLLKQDKNNENIYQWNYNRSGIPYEASKVQDIENNDALWEARSLIDGMGMSVAQMLGRRPTVREVLTGIPAAREVIGLLKDFVVLIGAPL